MRHGRHDDRLCVAAVFDTFLLSFLVGKECYAVVCYFTRVVCRIINQQLTDVSLRSVSGLSLD